MPWRARDVRPLVLRRRASRPQLKRDPLGASMPASTCISASMTSVLTTVLAAVACLCAAPPIATAQRIAPTPARTMERTFKIGNSTILEAEGPLSPYKVVFEDEGETGFFYAVDTSRPKDSQILDAVSIYEAAHWPDRTKPVTVRIRWSRDGKRAALFLNAEPQAVFDFVAKRGYARSNFPAASCWSAAGHAWSDSAMVGFDK